MSTPASAPPAGVAMPPEKRFPLVLLGFGILSLLAHALTFFLFQVTYPPPVTIPPQPMQVTLLSGDGPEEQALLRWVESEDPALVAASAHPVPARLFELPYTPSYMTSRTAPRSMPIVPEPPARAPGPELAMLLRSISPEGITTKAASAPTQSRLRINGSLESRLPKDAPAPYTPGSSMSLEEPSALLGVSPDGSVRFTVLQKSSGEPTTDAAFLKHLRKLRFAPVAERSENHEIDWAFASLSWGDNLPSAAAAR